MQAQLYYMNSDYDKVHAVVKGVKALKKFPTAEGQKDALDPKKRRLLHDPRAEVQRSGPSRRIHEGEGVCQGW